MPRLMRWLTCIHFIVWIAICAAQSSSSSNTITADDLVNLSKEGVTDELIISMVRVADQVPRLTPDDVIALKNKGVSMNVLTAVIQRRSSTTGTPLETPAEEKRRRIRVTASLHPQKRAWWNRRMRSTIDKTGVSWSLVASDWENRRSLAAPAQPNCSKDPMCKKWSPDDKCLDVIAPGSKEWQDMQACYIADKPTELGQEYEVFDVELPQAAADAEVHIYYRDVENQRLSWFTRSAPEAQGERVPGFVRLRLWGSEDFDLKTHIQLFISRDGFVQDFRVTECEVTNRDDDSLRRRLLSPERQYCHIEQSRLGG